MPWLLGVRHAGYYVAIAAFLGGMIVGLRAVLVVFVLAFIVAAVMYISATVSPPSGDDQRALVGARSGRSSSGLWPTGAAMSTCSRVFSGDTAQSLQSLE